MDAATTHTEPAGATNAVDARANTIRPRLLLIEDNADIRMLLSRIIGMHGIDVSDFPDGESAIDFVEHEGRLFDVLITDLVLPGMSGRRVYEILRSRGAVRNTIMISGYADDLVAETGRSGDDLDALHKPFEPDALIERIRAALNRPR